MSEPQIYNVEVTYRDAEPQKLQIDASHRNGEFRERTTYTFRLKGSTAVLSHIEPDGDVYQVQQATAERNAIAEEVEQLPFVQGVVMFE